MSEQEALKGKIKVIYTSFDGELEFACKQICKKNNWELDNYYDSYKECLRYKGYRKYLIKENKIYEVTECKDITFDGIAEAKESPDGTIDFILSYYNGGCSFSEAMKEALENLENNNE